MMRTGLRDVLVLSAITALIAAVFSGMFFPVTRILATPDFGRSDSWQFSYPTKYALWDALREQKVPLWRSDIGGGFPLYAEGQTGTFFLPNLILFSLFRPQTAYGIALALAFWVLAAGTYFSARSIGLGRFSSLYGAVIMSFSGLPVLQLTHITLLQGMALMPVIFAVTVYAIRSPGLKKSALLALFVSQQILAGFPQAVFLTAVLCGSFALWQLFRGRTVRAVPYLAAGWMLGFAGGAAQIIPSWEFLRESTHPGGFDFESATYFSMPLSHLVTFLFPFALGNPKFGTYPPFTAFDGSIFWENTAFFGILPVLLIMLVWIRKRGVQYVWFFSAALFVSLLLAWGKYSPAYIAYTFWPLTLFRIPSRFLWIAAFSGVLLASFGLHYLRTIQRPVPARKLAIAIFVVSVLELFIAWRTYHLFLPYTDLAEPQLVSLPYISGSVYTIGAEAAHNSQFIPNGWTDPEKYAVLYTGAYAPDGNIIFDVSHHDVYAGRFLHRYSVSDSLLKNAVSDSLRSPEAATLSGRLYSLFGIETIVSYIALPEVNLTLVDTATTSGFTRRIYTNPEVLPRTYVARTATEAATLHEAYRIIQSNTFTPGSTALLETADVHQYPELAGLADVSGNLTVRGTADITDASHTSVTIRAANPSDTPALLILMDTYYPGWQATVDDNSTRIYPVNLKQRAVIIPPGEHEVRFVYRPTTFVSGSILSLSAYAVIAVLAVFPGVSPNHANAQKNALQTPRRRRNRAR